MAPAASQTTSSSGETRHLTIPAPAHDFELALIARSGMLVGEAAKVRLVYSGSPPAEPASVLKPKLYAVTIGVSAYADPDLRLGYAADDARGFAEVLQKQKGGLYGDVQVKTLVDGEVTRASVVEALDWLEQQVTSRDFGGRADRRPRRHRREAALLVPACRRHDAASAHERGLAGRHRAHDGRAGRQGDPVSRHLPCQRGGGAAASPSAGRSTSTPSSTNSPRPRTAS